MLSSTTAFLPLPCNICRASKYPEFANLDSEGSIKNGRELVITFLLHLQSQSIFHVIFNYWFCSLCLFDQRRINPGIYWKMKGWEKEKTVKLYQAVTFWEKTLCPCLFTWMLFFFFLHPKKACQETCHLSGACDSRLSAHCLATRTASGYPGVTHTATAHCLALTALNHLTRCSVTPGSSLGRHWAAFLSAGPTSSGNGISRKNNIRVYLGIRSTKPPKSQWVYTGFHIK